MNITEEIKKIYPNHDIYIDNKNDIYVDGEYTNIRFSKVNDLISFISSEEAKEMLLRHLKNSIKKYLKNK